MALAITRFRDSNAIRLISFFLSFSPLAWVIGSLPASSLTPAFQCLCFQACCPRSPSSPLLLQAYILISSSSVQLQLENSQEFGWNGTSHILMAHTRASVVIGSSPIRIIWLNGSKRSCPVDLRMFPRTLVLQAERTTNDHDKK